MDRFEGGWIAEGLADDAVLECGVCWRVYDPALGDPACGVAAGTPFAQLPEGWRCPECDATHGQFLLVAEGAGPRRGARAPDMQKRLDALIAAYRDADLAMASLPIYNPALKVAAYGFRPDGEAFVGALATPWFINLVLLPQAKAPDTRALGATRAAVFPSGGYPFVAYRLDRVGAFEALSLFSPVLEFESQEAARLAAAAALDALYEPAAPPAQPAAEAGAPSRRTLLIGRRRPAVRAAP